MADNDGIRRRVGAWGRISGRSHAPAADTEPEFGLDQDGAPQSYEAWLIRRLHAGDPAP